MTKFAGPLVLAATLAVGSSLLASCVSKPVPPPAPPVCSDVLKTWGAQFEAEGRQIQGQGMPDGGVMVAAIGLKDVRILAILSQKQAPKFLLQVQQAGLKLAGEAGECTHPENGYQYVSIPLVKETKFEEARTSE